MTTNSSEKILSVAGVTAALLSIYIYFIIGYIPSLIIIIFSDTVIIIFYRTIFSINNDYRRDAGQIPVRYSLKSILYPIMKFLHRKFIQNYPMYIWACNGILLAISIVRQDTAAILCFTALVIFIAVYGAVGAIITRKDRDSGPKHFS